MIVNYYSIVFFNESKQFNFLLIIVLASDYVIDFVTNCNSVIINVTNYCYSVMDL